MLSGLERSFALSPRADLDSLSRLESSKELGRDNVFLLSPGERELRLPAEVRITGLTAIFA